MIVKKLVETKQEGEYEIKKFHVIKVDDITIKELEEIYEDWDDYEDAYYKGVAIDFNDEVIFINVNRFISAIKELIKESKEFIINIENYGKYKYPIIEVEEEHIIKCQNLIKRLEKYKGYDLWF